MNPAAPEEPRVQVVDTSGNAGTVPASELAQAQLAGYRAVTDPAELKAIQDREEFGEGFVPAAQAALMGVARGLTFGGSDEALIKGGAVSADTAKNLMEYQPAVSTVSKVVGQILPAFVPGGAEAEAAEGVGAARSLLAPVENFTAQAISEEGAANAARAGVQTAEELTGAASPAAKAARAAAPEQFADTVVTPAPTPSPQTYADFLGQVGRGAATPVKAVSSMGEAVQRSVEGSLGPGWLGKLGGAAARGSVEGAVYGAGDDVTEDAIGDKPMTAESLIATAGAGALLGAPIGAGFEGALGLGQKIVPTAMERASDRIKQFADRWTKSVPDSAAEIKELVGISQKANDGMVAAKQDFVDGAKRDYAAAVLGDQNQAGDAVNALAADVDVKYGTRKIQSANAEMEAAMSAAERAEKASAEFFKEFHGKDKYDKIRQLVGAQPVNPNVTYDLERALGNLAESKYGSATLDKFKNAIGEYATNFKEYLATNEVLQDAQRDLGALEAVGPQQTAAGLTEGEIAAHTAAARERMIPSNDPELDKQFIDKYVSAQAAKKLESVTAENARAAAHHSAQVAELQRHIQETQAHLAELPSLKNRADQFVSLDKLKKELDKIKRPVQESPRDALMFEHVKRARDEIRTMLQDEGLFNAAGAYQKQINAALTKHLASEEAFRSAFMGRAKSSTEKESGKFFVRRNKIREFVRKLAKGEATDEERRWVAHIKDTSDAVDQVAKLTFDNNPTRFKNAHDLAASLQMANSKASTAAEKLAAVRRAASEPRAAPLGQARAVAAWGAKLESGLNKATNDAGRFSVLDSVYQKMGRLPKLNPAEEAVRKQIGELLQDTTLFGDAAKMHVASETVFAQAKLARDAFEQRFFRKPVGVGELTPQVKTGSVEAHVNQFARGQARAADAAKTVDDYVKASKAALDYVHQEVYPRLSSPKTQRSTEAFLSKLEEQRGRAAAARKYDIENPKVHHPWTGVTHGGALAVGLHALGIHAALPAFVLYRLLRNPTQTLHVVGTAAGHAASVVKRLGELSKDVFTKVARKGGAVAGPAVSEILQGTNLGTKPSDKEQRGDAAKRIAQDLSKLADPEEFRQRMEASLATLRLRAPETAALVVNRGQKAVSYLLAHAPQAASPDSGLPGRKPWTPSDRDVFDYGQRVRAVSQPLSLLEDMRAGKLSASSVDAVRSVYPEIYQATVAGVQSQMARQHEQLTSAQLQQLSTLLGEPVGAVQRMLPALQAGATSPLPEQPQLDNGTQPQKKLPGSFAKLGESERVGTNLSSTQNKE